MLRQYRDDVMRDRCDRVITESLEPASPECANIVLRYSRSASLPRDRNPFMPPHV